MTLMLHQGAGGVKNIVSNRCVVSVYWSEAVVEELGTRQKHVTKHSTTI